MVVDPPAPYSSTVMLGLSSRQISRTPSSSIQTDLGQGIANMLHTADNVQTCKQCYTMFGMETGHLNQLEKLEAAKAA